MIHYASQSCNNFSPKRPKAGKPACINEHWVIMQGELFWKDAQSKIV